MQPHPENVGALAGDRSNDSDEEETEESNLLPSMTPQPPARVTVSHERGVIHGKIGVRCVLLVAAAALLAVVILRFGAAPAPRNFFLKQTLDDTDRMSTSTTIPPESQPVIPPLQNLHTDQVSTASTTVIHVPALPLQEQSQKPLPATPVQNLHTDQVSTASTTVIHVPALPLQEQSQKPLPATPVQNLQLKQVPTNIMIMAQVGNIRIWPDLRACISNVAALTRLTRNKTFTVRLYLAMTTANAVIEADAKSVSGLHEAIVVMVENRGADIGEFMQQLSLMRSKAADIDIILKIHSKTRSDWRKQMTCSLCGNPKQVLSIMEMFEKSSNLGIVGPPGLIFGVRARQQDTWGRMSKWAFKAPMEQDMRRTWDFMFPNQSVPYPTRDRFLISAGSFFWARPAPLFFDKFQSAIPIFIEMFDEGYHRNKRTFANTHLYALERVIPTMIHGHFMLDYAAAPRNVDQHKSEKLCNRNRNRPAQIVRQKPATKKSPRR